MYVCMYVCNKLGSLQDSHRFASSFASRFASRLASHRFKFRFKVRSWSGRGKSGRFCIKVARSKVGSGSVGLFLLCVVGAIRSPPTRWDPREPGIVVVKVVVMNVNDNRTYEM